MELSWPIRLRIISVLGLGIVVLGIRCWPLVSPTDPILPVMAVSIGIGPIVALIGVALLTGFVAYLVPWPYGLQIAPLAVPAGMAVWALRSEQLFKLMQRCPDVSSRVQALQALRWDGLLWLIIVAAGLLGLHLASMAIPKGRTKLNLCCPKPRPLQRLVTDGILGMVLSTVVSYILIVVFAQGTNVIGGTIQSQPAGRQVCFGVFVAFWAAAFLCGRFLGLDFYWPVASTALLSVVGNLLLARPTVMAAVAQDYPASCLPSAILAALPVQMISFGSLGAIAGYWTSIRFEYWRRHLRG